MDSFLGEIVVLRRAFTVLAERYFDGEPVLFSKAAADVDELVVGLERIAEFCTGLAPILQSCMIAGVN